MTASSNSVIGTWKLVSADIRSEDGTVAYPFGHDVVGLLILTTDGYLSKQFGMAHRPSLPIGDWLSATTEEVAAAARGYFAYCGTYEVRGSELIYNLDQSLMPNWIGSAQARAFTIEGDILTTTTPILPLEGKPQTSTLVWKRA